MKNYKISSSQVASDKSSINNSKNNVSIKRVRTETVIISFIVGFFASILASYVFESFSK